MPLFHEKFPASRFLDDRFLVFDERPAVDGGELKEKMDVKSVKGAAAEAFARNLAPQVQGLMEEGYSFGVLVWADGEPEDFIFLAPKGRTDHLKRAAREFVRQDELGLLEPFGKPEV